LSKNEFIDIVESLGSIYLVMEHFSCSRNTVRNYLKKFNVKTPRGFYSTGKKIGRPKGIPCSEKQKSLMSEKFSGKDNPFYGRCHTDNAKNKMSKNHADFFGDKNPFKKSLSDPSKLEEHKRRCLNIWKARDIEWRRAFSEKLSKAMAESNNFKSPNFHKNHKSGHFESSKCGKVFFRSSWEERLCIALSEDENVEAFNLEEFTIKYNDGDINRHTRIDFTILTKDSTKYMIEVKPRSLIDKNHLKINEMKSYSESNGYLFYVWSIEEIERYERTKEFE